MAERERAQKNSKGDDTAFALQLFLMKALDENGNKLFSMGQAAEVKNDVRDADLQKLMLAVIQEDVAEEIDPKD